MMDIVEGEGLHEIVWVIGYDIAAVIRGGYSGIDGVVLGVLHRGSIGHTFRRDDGIHD